MAFFERSTLWRDPNNCAHTSWMRRVFTRLASVWAGRKHPHVADLSDRMLRDVGMSPNDRPEHRHQYPSQTTHHPRG